MESKFYSFETKNKGVRNRLINYLKRMGVYYELSGCYNGWHFEIKLPESWVKIVNDNLDSFHEMEGEK